MYKNPYSELPKSAFWKTGVAQENPYWIKEIYKKKFDIHKETKIATAGSCFAQHITRHLKQNGFKLLDLEPPPPGLPEASHQKFGYSMFSARYGNIYSVRQLLQLTQEASGDRSPENFIWEKNGKFFDALRPGVEPEGFDTPEEVFDHRQIHISRVKEVYKKMDLFIFTLGLTEMWIHKESGTVYPTAPGVLAGQYNDDAYEFKNAQFEEIKEDFSKFQATLKKLRGEKPLKLILTVSPVPLTATASGDHILKSTTYSKSILRAAAGQISHNEAGIDYFPAYEIVSNPRMHSSAFSENLRSVRDEIVEVVMKHFFAEHKAIHPKSISPDPIQSPDNKAQDIQCEEALLDAF